MEHNKRVLLKKFLDIKDMGWIKTKRNGSTGVGYTFEELLGKKEDNLMIPDFQGIEIKTIRYNSRKKIHLLTATPDGNAPFPIKRVVNLLGYKDQDLKQFKVFQLTLKTNEYNCIDCKRISIEVNYNKKRIDLLAHTIYGEKIDVDTSWSFELLKKNLFIKFKELAIVKARSKFIDGEEYFLYRNIDFYKLKSFETFLSLIEKGIIGISFQIGIWKSQEKIGKIHDRGTDFSILEKDIPLLFDLVK